MKIEDLTGQIFGRLKVVEFHSSKNWRRYWVCICECGKTKIIAGSSLKCGNSTSCGCYNRELICKHGQYQTSEYYCWEAMTARCTNPNNPMYYRYGGRGITVCEEWKNNFKNFLSDMGNKPSSKHSIDRINNDGDYNKNNCRWATTKEQANNTSRSTKEEIDGLILSRTDTIKHIGIGHATFYYYLKKGYNPQEIKTIFNNKKLQRNEN